MSNIRFLFILALFSAITFSCKKDTVAGDPVEIYVLQNYSMVPGKCMVNPFSAVLESDPTVKNEDIIEYSQLNYEFKLTGISFQKIKAFPDLTPFAVTVDKNVIYYGFYKKWTSSSSCDHSIIMSIKSLSDQTISMDLGYPFGMTGIDDQRNNAVLTDALRKQDKLR